MQQKKYSIEEKVDDSEIEHQDELCNESIEEEEEDDEFEHCAKPLSARL